MRLDEFVRGASPFYVGLRRHGPLLKAGVAVAYRVSLRAREIGLRMALGATRVSVFRSVVSNAVVIVAVGVIIGESLTAVLTGIVASVQENIGRTPLSTHVIVGLIWMAIGVTASYVPAARAARLDRSVALRDE
jgi:putative ABC transport system permease protein